MANTEPQLKLMTKADFNRVKSKFVDIKPEAEEMLEKAVNDSDVLALTVQEGSGFTLLNAKIISEDNEEGFVQLLKEGVNN